MLHKWTLGVAMMAAASTFVYSSEQRADVSISVGAEGGIKAPADGKVSVNFFYDALSPYGTWVQDQKHGWAWQPQVAVETKEWRPYFNDGHWVLTDQGWFWQSEYEWGWIGFHYGRWHQRENNWVWVPDTTWAPAWVSWRESENAFGWAPLPPEATYEASVGVTLREELPADYFIFVPSRSFLSINLTTVAMPRTEVHTVYNQTRIVKNTYVTENNRIVNRGIPAERVTQVTGQKVETVKLADAKVEGGQAITGEKMQNNQMTVYRPQVSKDAGKAEPSAAAREAKAKKQSGKTNTADKGAAPQSKDAPKDAQKQPAREDRSQAQPKQDGQPSNTAAGKSEQPSATKADAPGRNMKAGASADAKADQPKDSKQQDKEKKDAAKPADRSQDRSALDRQEPALDRQEPALDRQEPAMNTSADRKTGSGDQMAEPAEKPQGDPRRNNPSMPSAHQPDKPDVTNPSARPQAPEKSQGIDSAKPSAPSTQPSAPRDAAKPSSDAAKPSGDPGKANDAARSPAATSNSAAKPPKASSSEAPKSSASPATDRNGAEQKSR